jgi:hypothetical protein
MQSLVEQLAIGVFQILSRADARLTTYQHNCRGRMRLQEAERSSAQRATSDRLTPLRPKTLFWESTASK